MHFKGNSPPSPRIRDCEARSGQCLTLTRAAWLARPLVMNTLVVRVVGGGGIVGRSSGGNGPAMVLGVADSRR